MLRVPFPLLPLGKKRPRADGNDADLMPANLVLDGRARQPAQRQDALQGLLVEPATATAGGGGYFRVLPYRLSRALIRRVNRTDRRAAVFYLIPGSSIRRSRA
jgi:hypothetical protein